MLEAYLTSILAPIAVKILFLRLKVLLLGRGFREKKKIATESGNKLLKIYLYVLENFVSNNLFPTARGIIYN